MDATRELPDHVAALDSLTVIPADAQPPDTVELVPVREFKSNEDVLIRGYIGEAVVDDQDRVYINTFGMSEAAIYVFEPDGSYLTTLGRFGKGPGEFVNISSMDLWNDRLYVFDGTLQKYVVYSLDDFSLLKEEGIVKDRVNKVDTMARTMKGQDLFVTENGSMLLRLRSITLSQNVKSPKILYFRLAEDGTLVPGRVLVQDRYRALFPGPSERTGISRPAPFSRGSLLEVSESGPIYTNWMEDFLIKVYDQDGNYSRAIYYPYENRTLNVPNWWLDAGWDTWIDGNWDQVPATWPAIHTMKVDDQDRLWVSTITESDSTYKWWIFDEQGDLLARFDWPGKRWERTILTQQSQFTIKHGYFYTKDLNFQDQIYRVIKHRIDFISRESQAGTQ